MIQQNRMLWSSFVIPGVVAAVMSMPIISWAQGQAAPAAAPVSPEIHAVLEKMVHPKKVKVGDAVEARMTEPTKLKDGTELPKGTHIIGKVTEVKMKADKEGPVKAGRLVRQGAIEGRQRSSGDDGAGERRTALGARRSRPGCG